MRIVSRKPIAFVVALVPIPNSCAFHNRSVKNVAANLPLFKPILEFTGCRVDGFGRQLWCP
jgi:hypothetical protein